MKSSSMNGNILIVRNDHLGDSILSLPVIPPILKHFPDSKVYFWSSATASSLIECVKGISGVLVSSDRHPDSALIKLSELNIQHAFCLRPTFSNAKTLKLAGIPSRYGTSRRLYSFLFNRRVGLKRRGGSRHEVNLNFVIVQASGVKGEPSFPEIELTEEVKNNTVEQLSKGGLAPNERYIIIHPGSAGSAREWALNHFKVLADKILDITGLVCVITGIREEAEKCMYVSGSKHINLCEMTNILSLAAIISNSELVIANSTGPLHLAVALGKKVLGLYPPVKDCTPDRWGPYGHNDWALMPELPLCSKCVPGDISNCRCMENISPDTVMKKLMTILES